MWAVGYGATDLYPHLANFIWGGLVFTGTVVSFLIGKATASRDAASAAMARTRGLRMFGLVALLLVFMGATYAIMGPIHGLQPAAFPALLIGAIYCGVGLWAGVRYLILGALVIALTVVGYFFLSEHYLLLMAFVGGGGLILAGFWFRQV